VRGLVPLVFIAPLVGIGTSVGDVGLLVAAVGYVVGFVAWIRLLVQRGHLGYDVGDAAVGQRLVQEQTGAPLGTGGMVFVRQLAHILDSLACYIGYLWPLWDSKNQTFADKIMTTVVVEDPAQRHSAGDLFKNALMIWTPVTKD
jgi:uncharacterized RDD family membrane protein YckC